MNCGFSDLFCCIKPCASVSFNVSKIALNGTQAYADVFIQVDRTYIYDTDYLCISKPNEINSNQKIIIVKEPGDMSGVSRVTFPDENEVYKISYIRYSNQKRIVIGEYLINVPVELKERISTDDTEDYSPLFRPSLNKKYMLFKSNNILNH